MSRPPYDDETDVPGWDEDLDNFNHPYDELLDDLDDDDWDFDEEDEWEIEFEWEH